MKSVLVLLFLCHYSLDSGTAEHEKYVRTIQTNEDQLLDSGKNTVNTNNVESDLSHPKYSKLENRHQSEEVAQDFQDFLLFAQRDGIRRLNLVTLILEDLPVKNLSKVIAIDYDMKRNCVYWADVVLDTISRQCLNNSDPEILVSSDLESVEGIAFDWVSNNLYFVDGDRSKIEIIQTDIDHSGRMRRTILGPEVLKKPRGIAVHPVAGYMFWTDWHHQQPSVNRANLDGTNIKQLFGKPDVGWPNGITIDYMAQRVYWADALQDYIASSDLHGDNFKKIIYNNDAVSHPFGIAVFKNNIYWDDWKVKSIFRAHKDGYHGVEVLQKEMSSVMDLKIYAPGLQVGTNACKTKGCAYICVGTPKGDTFSCLCPDGMTSHNGVCQCPGSSHPFANFTCPQKTCAAEHFSCGNGLCVPKDRKCNGDDDCGDNSDEAHCGLQTCPPNYFVCGDGKCLPYFWKCDYDVDCADGSDELNCPRVNCTERQFGCKNGSCISAKWKCDGQVDCKDGSDEENCTPVEPKSCIDYEFQCNSGTIKCIPLVWQCDGDKDCRDGSDELDCKNMTCLDTQFACGGPKHKCIYSALVCDGKQDCPDGKDEANCSTTAHHVENATDHSNLTNRTNTAEHHVDKPIVLSVPKNETCHNIWRFQCANHQCIPHWWKCDGADDCGDGSDEMGCSSAKTPTKATTSVPRLAPTCGTKQYQCDSGDCIYLAWVCDGMEDCAGGDDEKGCDKVFNCTKGQFRCRKDGRSISPKLLCNQFNDCPDGSDEMECDHIVHEKSASCSKGYFLCKESSSCYPLAALCDGKWDCVDGYDESNCTSTTRIYQVLYMDIDERSINESSILFYWVIPIPPSVNLEFMPSISKVEEETKWTNHTWTSENEYLFKDLEPDTQYNLTVYVRIQNRSTVFVPTKYIIACTAEGVPSEPWNFTAVQLNGSHVLLSWNGSADPKGQIIKYEISWYPPLPPTKLTLDGNRTTYVLSANFAPGVEYSFYVIAHNRNYASERSEVVTLIFSGNSTLENTTEHHDLTLPQEYNKTGSNEIGGSFTETTTTDDEDVTDLPSFNANNCLEIGCSSNDTTTNDSLEATTFPASENSTEANNCAEVSCPSTETTTQS